MFFIISISLCLILTIVKRTYEYNKLSKEVIHLCYRYDKFHSANQFETLGDDSLIKTMLKNENYFLHSEWSAIRYMIKNSPNKILFILSFKEIDIFNVYDSILINKLKKYNLI